MIRRILLAHDGSTGTDRALDVALDLARKYAAELHVLAVARPPEFRAHAGTMTACSAQ